MRLEAAVSTVKTEMQETTRHIVMTLTNNISHVDPASSVFLMNEAMVILTINCTGGVDTVPLVSSGSYVLARHADPRVFVT